MRKIKLLNPLFLGLLAAVALSFNSCSDDDNNDPDPNPNPGEDTRYFNLVLGVGDDGNDGVYMQAHEDISNVSTSITFKGFGYKVPADRTARVTSSEDGNYVYSLDYGGGTLTKFKTNGGQSYTKLMTIDVKPSIATHPRWGKVNDDMALLHNITTEHKYKDAEKTDYEFTEATAQLVGINLGKNDADLTMGSIQTLVIPRSTEDIERNIHIWRIDAPVVHNGKVYYGVAKRGYDPATGKNISLSDYKTTTLVADYPSLNNLKTISSEVATGENYGYRTPVNYVDEKGDIYQMVGNGQKACLLKIRNEAYDNSYKLDLSQKLGFEVGALGWFYVGDGIGYALYYDLEKGQSEAESAWGVARVDVYNQTAIKMNVPSKLWLRQYQKGVLEDGKFYMALTPVGEEGAVYIFDPKSTSADGFTKGAKLENLGGQFYIGIF